MPFESKDNSSFNLAVRLRSGVAAFSAHACRHSFGFNYMARGGNLLALIRRAPIHHRPKMRTRHVFAGSSFGKMKAFRRN